jgi:hypothetical protein
MLPTNEKEMPHLRLLSVLNRRMKDLAAFFRARDAITPLLAGDANPSVIAGSKVYKTQNAGATNLASFREGVPGQTFLLLAGDANTTLVHSANLILKGAVNVLLAAGNTKQFFTEDGAVWREYPAP